MHLVDTDKNRQTSHVMLTAYISPLLIKASIWFHPFEAENDFGDWKNHHQINVIATSIQNPCFCKIESCEILTQTQLRAHLAPLLIPSDGKIHSQLPFQLLDAIIPSIHSISPQCLVVIKVWNKANPLLDAFEPFQSSLPKSPFNMSVSFLEAIKQKNITPKQNYLRQHHLQYSSAADSPVIQMNYIVEAL